MKRDPIPAKVLATRLIPNVSPDMAKELGLTPDQKSLALITADCDDVTYTALDEATKKADCKVVYAKSFYAGAANANTALAGEIIGILAAPNPAEAKAGLDAAVDMIENVCHFVSANDTDDVCYYAHCISRTGSYLSATMFLSVAACLITLCAAAWKGVFGGRRKRQTGVLIAFTVGVPLLLLADTLLFHGRILHLAEYQIMRIRVLLNPDAYGAGYQTLLVREQLSSASLFGGGSIGKAGELSGAWCDYVLICLASYFGLLIAIAVVAAVCAFLVRSLHIAFLQSNRLGFLLGVACSSILMLKTIIYVAMNFGIGPMIGIDMPFLTYGLHCTLLNFLFMGIILSVYRHTNLLPELKKEAPRYRLKLEKAGRS